MAATKGFATPSYATRTRRTTRTLARPPPAPLASPSPSPPLLPKVMRTTTATMAVLSGLLRFIFVSPRPRAARSRPLRVRAATPRRRLLALTALPCTCSAAALSSADG